VKRAILIVWSWVGGVRGSGRSDDCPGAGKPGEKWRHLQRHLFACRSNGHGSDLDQFHTVIPGVELDASAQRQGCDLVQLHALWPRTWGLKLADADGGIKRNHSHKGKNKVTDLITSNFEGVYRFSAANRRPNWNFLYFYRLCTTRDSLTTSALGIA
jgi:hypothetical protein